MKITGLQVFWMIMTMDLGMTMIMTMTPGLKDAKQDVWISILVAGCIAVLVTSLVTKVAGLYPGETLIQFSRKILGKWLGTIVLVIYFIQWFTIIPIVLRQFNDTIQVMILNTTPKLAIMVIMVALITYVTYSGGIVSIARCSEILGPVIILMVLLVLVASLNNIEMKNLLPVFADNGAFKIVKASSAPASYLGHAVEYLMLAAFLYQPRNGAPYAYWGVITASFVVLLAMIMVVLTLGVTHSPNKWYPFFEMARKIHLFEFIENLDPLTIIIWVSSVFIKLAIYLFITCYGVAEFLQIKNWRRLLWFVVPIITIYALFPRNVVEATGNYLLNYWVPIAVPVNMLGLPLLMLIVAKIKQGRKVPEDPQAGDPRTDDNGQQAEDPQMEGTQAGEAQTEDSSIGEPAAGASQAKGPQASEGLADMAQTGEPEAGKPQAEGIRDGSAQDGGTPSGATHAGDTQAGMSKSGGLQPGNST